jgi:phage anti-repressor protein
MGAVSGAKLERGRDYERAGPPRVNKQTGRSGVHVVFSIPAAKKIAMMASGDRGHAIRLYYIEQANRLSTGQPPLPFFAELQQ